MKPSFSERLRLTDKITCGLFLTDKKRSIGGRIWQLFSRFTWELPQTLVGWLYSANRALFGQVDHVLSFSGITYAVKSDAYYSMGVSLGTFVDIWVSYVMRDEGDGFIFGDQLCMHEFGHTIDSQRFGWAYLPVIGLASLKSALGKGNHRVFWTEIRANCHSKKYFGKHYGIAWNESYPTEKKA